MFLTLYGMGLIVAGGFTGILITVACGPQIIKDKFNKLLWNPEEE